MDCFRIAPAVANGEGYGENGAVDLWESCLRVLPATGDPMVEGGILGRKCWTDANGKDLAWDCNIIGEIGEEVSGGFKEWSL